MHFASARYCSNLEMNVQFEMGASKMQGYFEDGSVATYLLLRKRFAVAWSFECDDRCELMR